MHQSTFRLTYLIELILLIISINCIVAIKEETDRIFSAEELSKYKGEDKESLIYLSVLGEVYDVTSGREFYEQGQGYSYFAGRDATVSFFTGEYKEEDNKGKRVMDYKPEEILSMSGWREFYEKHETYRFLGILEGEYYDNEGKPTPYLEEIRSTVAIAVEKVEEDKRKRRERREEAQRKRDAEKAQSEL
mmetsp:Transcript_25163/g.29127  ORF Transcript_25163/g.29127 Transcript_25163/m.29127 type:complete len:190 (-) Transcript_25163:159-728(-)